MSEKLTPYDDYIETNLDWINHVPSHWAEQTMRSFTKLSSQRNNDREDLELLSVYREYGVIRKSSRDDNHNVESQDLSNYKFVDKGYLVLNKMKMWQGSLGVSKYTGIVSPAYIVCKLIGDVNYNYIHYLLRSPCYKTIYNRLSYGVRVGQWDMRYDDFKNIKLFLPPLPEQDQIAKYLDSKLAKIARFIRAKKKLIEVLKEQKQAIINEAVTKGLDPNAKMKPSGVAWLGDIPENWGIRKIGAVYDIELGKMLQPQKNSSTDTKEKYLCATNVFWDGIHISNLKEMWFSKNDKEKYKLLKNDLIVVEGGDVATCSLWNFEKVDCYIQNAVHRVRSNNNSISFLRYWLFTLKKLGYIDLMCNKATLAHFTKEKFSNLFIFLPSLFEQQEIVTYIETKTKTIEDTIATTQKEIDLITEYRARLISDVVTGKVDVRGVFVEDSIEDVEIEENEIENEERNIIEGED